MPQEAGYNESSVVLPSLFGPPGAALENVISRKQQDKAFEYQKQKQNEQDEWRKVNLINELTDLSQYQTPDSAANKIGEDRAAEVLQKYTSNIKTMSPADLLGNIKKDMTDVHIGMNAIKDEFAQAHAVAAELKKQSPELDAGALEMELRGDITKRRLKGDASFVPQMEVQPSQIDLNDDEYLSKFVSSDKQLREAIQNPKGLDAQRIPVGNFEQNMEYEAKVPAWKTPSFTNEDLQKGGGFLAKGTVPELKVKEQPIPTDLLKGSDGKQLIGVTQEVYDSFMTDRTMKRQVINNTKSRYKDYDKMSPEQKEAAKSATIREMIGELDKTGFRQVGTPQRARKESHTTVNVGGGDDAKINKSYERINSKIDEDIKKGFTSTRFNSLANDSQEIIKAAVKNAGFVDAYGEAAIGEGGKNIHIAKDKDGKIKIYKVGEDRKLFVDPEHEITTLSYIGTNFGKQTGKQGKENVIAKDETGRAITKPPTSSNRPPLSSFGKPK